MDILRARSWRAASKPKPELTPVMVALLSVRLMPEGRGCSLRCESAETIMASAGRMVSLVFEGVSV